METKNSGRRAFLRSALAAAAMSPLSPYLTSAADQRPAAPKSPNDRPRIGVIGMRYQGSVIADKARAHGDLVAFCDVDRHVREMAKACFGSTQKIHEDYQALLDDKRIDVILIGAPDHWHAKMAIDAMKAGKDIYVEKPLTLTVDEGKAICKVAKETQRVVQVGTWQRSDINFRLACELVKAGRLGKIRKVVAVAGENPAGGPFAPAPVPSHLNWDLWLGQAPKVEYVPERCHYTFRWWWDYAGGKMTDWGAHHLDIIQWALGEQYSGPTTIEGGGTFSGIKEGYQVPVKFQATLTYASGVVVEARDAGENGIHFEGDKGWLFVERGKIRGSVIDELKTNPLPRDRFKLYAHDAPNAVDRTDKLGSLVSHMENFFECVRSRNRATISDPESQHRSATVCHLANIAIRLGRKLQWDPGAERFVSDSEADGMLARVQRKGFQVVA
jgi:myo-inositol 2-dehydrogenase/D-chiro-inositol 1-dehydrogenase